jgi:hypothetical protein
VRRKNCIDFGLSLVACAVLLVTSASRLVAQRSTTIAVRVEITSELLRRAYTPQQLQTAKRKLCDDFVDWLTNEIRPWTYQIASASPQSYLLDILVNGALGEVAINVSIVSGGRRLKAWPAAVWEPGRGDALCCGSPEETAQQLWKSISLELLKKREEEIKSWFLRIPVAATAQWKTQPVHRLVLPLGWDDYSFLVGSGFLIRCGGKDIEAWPKSEPEAFDDADTGRSFPALSLLPKTLCDQGTGEEKPASQESLMTLCHIKPSEVRLMPERPQRAWDMAVPEAKK